MLQKSKKKENRSRTKRRRELTLKVSGWGASLPKRNGEKCHQGEGSGQEKKKKNGTVGRKGGPGGPGSHLPKAPGGPWIPPPKSRIGREVRKLKGAGGGTAIQHSPYFGKSRLRRRERSFQKKRIAIREPVEVV